MITAHLYVHSLTVLAGSKIRVDAFHMMYLTTPTKSPQRPNSKPCITLYYYSRFYFLFHYPNIGSFQSIFHYPNNGSFGLKVLEAGLPGIANSAHLVRCVLQRR